MISSVQKTQSLEAKDITYELILRRIRLLSQRRVAWLRKIWTEITAHKTDSFDMHTEIDGYFYDLDIPSEEQKWIKIEPSMQRVNEEIREINHILENDQDSRFSTLSHIFGLNRLET
ncbi:MAG: hypothetical protein WD431_06215, partial [Cyclobacteriaceae bacterium]